MPKVTNIHKRLKRQAGKEFRYESDFGKWFCGFVKHFCPDDITFMHIANERRTTPQRGASLKAQGVQPGVSDYLWLSKRAAIELKLPGGRISPTQKAFIEAAKNIDWKTYVLFGKAQAYLCLADLTGIPITKLQQYDALKQISKYQGGKPTLAELANINEHGF